MTPERLAFVVDRLRGRVSHAHVARILRIAPLTLRRYLKGERPIPSRVEIVLEILHAHPNITTDVIDRLIAKLDQSGQ